LADKKINQNEKQRGLHTQIPAFNCECRLAFVTADDCIGVQGSPKGGP